MPLYTLRYRDEFRFENLPEIAGQLQRLNLHLQLHDHTLNFSLDELRFPRSVRLRVCSAEQGRST